MQDDHYRSGQTAEAKRQVASHAVCILKDMGVSARALDNLPFTTWLGVSSCFSPFAGLLDKSLR